jgi:hypothetical protein
MKHTVLVVLFILFILSQVQDSTQESKQEFIQENFLIKQDWNQNTFIIAPSCSNHTLNLANVYPCDIINKSKLTNIMFHVDVSSHKFSNDNVQAKEDTSSKNRQSELSVSFGMGLHEKLLAIKENWLKLVY